MLIDVNKLALNRILQGSTLEEYEHSKDPDYLYKANRIDSSGTWYSITKNGHWSKSDQKNGFKADSDIVTQFNFISTAVNYISDMFIIVDYSRDSDRFLIYRDTQSKHIAINSKGIFGKEYILHNIPYDESKNIYDKFWELKQRLKWGARDVV